MRRLDRGFNFEAAYKLGRKTPEADACAMWMRIADMRKSIVSVESAADNLNKALDGMIHTTRFQVGKKLGCNPLRNKGRRHPFKGRM